MKVVITARNYRVGENKGIKLLESRGFEVVDFSDGNHGTGTTEEEMAQLIGDADAVITGLEPIGETVLSSCPNLKLAARRGVGYDSVDVAACRRHGVTATRITGMVEAGVSEQVIAYIMWFARDLEKQNASMQRGEWNRIMSYGAKNRTLGLVGFGGIGKEVATRALALGMNLVYYCRHPKYYWEQQYRARYVSFEELLRESDYISINVPLSDETRGMFGAEQFAMMKPECVLINIARGPIVDTKALREALDKGIIRGAGIDVFDTEPCTDSPLIGCTKAILTPHTAPYTSENFGEMNLKAAENVCSFFDGRLDPKYRLT